MTPVKFEFFEPDGTPLSDVTFEIRMAKSGFLDPQDGIVMPDTVEAITNADGKVTVMLAPSSSLYYLTVLQKDADDTDCCGGKGIRYKFYVPQVEAGVEVRVQDLIMDPPPSTTAWDEAAMLLIMDAKISSKASADAAKQSEINAKGSEEKVAADAATATEAAASALDSKEKSKLSEEASKLHEDNSKLSQDASRTSELAAAESARLAQAAQSNMDDQIAEAKHWSDEAHLASDASRASADNSGASAQASAESMTTAGEYKDAAALSAQATAADVVATTNLKGEAKDFRDQAEIFRNEAQAAAGTVAGVLSDGGLVDLSGGAYPPKPTVSTIWRVTVGGTVTTAKEGTVTFGIGDQLVYTLAQDLWYKIDNQQAVTSVNDKTGAVKINAADVGLDKVNNTSDMEKPVSNAVQTQLNSRVPTASTTDVTAGRLTKVGDYGENGGPALVKINTDDPDLITVGGKYLFPNGSPNQPEASYYLNHINSATAGYAKQLAYGFLTDKTYVRTQKSGVWGGWAPSVDIVDALTSSDPAKALSARQGKILLDMLQANNATIVRYTYRMAAGQSVITGPDLSGLSLSYVPGVPFMVEKDGFPIWLGADYTASNGSSVTLVKPTSVSSDIAITVFGSFSVADHYNKAQVDLKLQEVAAQAAEAVLTTKWVASRDMVALGTVPLDGDTYSRTTYPDAWALIRDGKVPKVSDAAWLASNTNRGCYTEGDGSTTFRVPDYNGKSSGAWSSIFLRGDGTNSAAAGQIQTDALQGHQHTVNIAAVSGTNTTNGLSNYGTGTGGQYNTMGNLTAGRQATETRPSNVAGVWTVRLFGSVSNVGNVDVAQLAAQLNVVDARSAVNNTILGTYVHTQMARDFLSPGEGNIIAWSVDVDKMFRKNVDYSISTRAFTFKTAGLYRINFQSLSYTVPGGATDVSLIKTTPQSVSTQRRAYTFTPAGQNVSFGTNWTVRFNVGDTLYLSITRGSLFAPDATDSSAFTTLDIDMIDI